MNKSSLHIDESVGRYGNTRIQIKLAGMTHETKFFGLLLRI